MVFPFYGFSRPSTDYFKSKLILRIFWLVRKLSDLAKFFNFRSCTIYISCRSETVKVVWIEFRLRFGLAHRVCNLIRGGEISSRLRLQRDELCLEICRCRRPWGFRLHMCALSLLCVLCKPSISKKKRNYIRCKHNQQNTEQLRKNTITRQT